MLHHPHIHNPLESRDCVSCPPTAPICNCQAGYSCVQTVMTCSVCATAQCIAPESHGSSSSGVSKGAMAGAVVAVLAFLFIVIGGFLYWRRRSSQRRQARSRRTAVENIPGVVYAKSPVNQTFSGAGMDAVEKGPNVAGDANPFDEGRSTHSIPIGLSDGQLSPGTHSPTGTAFNSGAPMRPQRSPELNIRNGGSYFDQARPTSTAALEPPRPNYAPSQRSGFTVSTMDSTASSAMEALYESPTILSAAHRQVIGAGRAEVVNVSGLSHPSSPRSPVSSTRRSQAGPSPLSPNYGTRLPTTVEEDPFGDDGRSIRSTSTGMSSVVTFGMGTPTASIRTFHPATASRVNVASLSRSATLRSMISTGEGNDSLAATGTLDHPLSRRVSNESVVSNTDSFLSTFPFVPPSPVPNIASRSPLSVVFTSGDSDVDRQSRDSNFTVDPHASAVPPLPSRYGVSGISSARASSTTSTTVATDGSYPSTSTSPSAALTSPNAPSTINVTSASSSMNARMSSGSAVSSGLGEFDFHFAGAEEDVPPVPALALPPPPPPAQQQPPQQSAPGPTSVQQARAAAAAKVAAQITAAEENADPRASRASLDLFALSRDLAANRLPYD